MAVPPNLQLDGILQLLMLQLTRQVRCFWPTEPTPTSTTNRWVSLTPVQAFQPLLTIEVTIEGLPCPRSGFIVNIRDIDHCVAEIITIFAQATSQNRAPKPIDAWEHLAELGRQIQTRFAVQLPGLASGALLAQCRLLLSPQIGLELNGAPTSTIQPYEKGQPMGVILTQQFEFSAAHRLNCPDWSPEENARVFGKCNYPSGHGHNYLLDVSISHPEGQTPAGSDVQWLTEWVQRIVLNRLDHRFLNQDVPEFRELNPTVENIAQVIFTWLSSELPADYRLEKVRVFETAKTWADCFALPVSR